jgi:hypothetical protein
MMHRCADRCARAARRCDGSTLCSMSVVTAQLSFATARAGVAVSTRVARCTPELRCSAAAPPFAAPSADQLYSEQFRGRVHQQRAAEQHDELAYGVVIGWHTAAAAGIG